MFSGAHATKIPSVMPTAQLTIGKWTVDLVKITCYPCFVTGRDECGEK